MDVNSVLPQHCRLQKTHGMWRQDNKLKRGAYWAIAFLAAVILLIPGAYAQVAGTGSIQGTVQDPTGAVIAGASVTLTETATQVSQTTSTGHDGLFGFPNIKIGVYSISATAPGFQTYVQQNIVLEVGSSISVNVKLPIGSSTEQVEVQAEGLSLQTEDASFKQTVDERSVTELPLNGREVTGLITLSGAAVSSTSLTQGNKGFFSSVSPQLAGGQGNQTDYRLDGGDNNDYMSNTSFALPFPDAIEQFSVQTAATGVQTGLHPAGRVDVVTRSGTDQYHGTAFEFIRNNVINATNYFSASKDTLHQDQYGGTLGGRIIKSKLFFFAGYQHLYQSAGSASTVAYVPTASVLRGDFSKMDPGQQLLNPKTGAVLPNNFIDPSNFNKSALALVKYFPTPSDEAGTVKYSIPVFEYENQFITRVDANLNSNHMLYGRYFVDSFRTPSLYSPTNVLITNNPGNTERAQTLTIGENWVIKSNLVNTIHVTGTRRTNTRGPAAEGLNATSLGINVYQPYPIGLRVQGGKFNTYCSTCAPGKFDVNSMSVIDDLDWIIGKHQIVLGGEYIRAQENINNAFSSNGNFTFNGQFSQKGPAGTSKGGTAAEPLLDFLTGSLELYTQSKPQQNALRAPIPSLYAQDTYHVTHKLVLTAGLRWGPEIWPTDYFGRGSTFDLSAFQAGTHSSVYPNAPAGTFFYGDKGVTKNFASNRWMQFSPRVGATYDPFGDGKTVFRVGGGLVFDETNFFAASQPNYNPPFATLVTNNISGAPLDFTNPWSTGSSAGNPFPMPIVPDKSATFSKGVQYIVYGQNFQSPEVVQWTASVQRQIGRGWQVQIDYIGNKSSHQAYGNPLNPAIYIPGTWTGSGSCGALTVSPGTGSACSSTGNSSSRYKLALLNPAQGAYYSGGGSGSSTTAMVSGSNASYNGMVATVEHRASKSFTFLANYTWSHCISLLDNSGSFNSTVVENPNNIKMDYARCGFDLRSMFNSSIVAVSNFRLTGWEAYAINHWQLAPIIRATTGTPFNVTTGADNSLTAIGNDRPNVSTFTGIYTRIHPPSTPNAKGAYLNVANFSPNALGTYGNLGRNRFVGPTFVDLDASLSRIFPLHDKLNMQLRFETFNLPNHPNFNNPTTTTINSSNFGEITTAQAPRIAQGAIKLNF